MAMLDTDFNDPYRKRVMRGLSPDGGLPIGPVDSSPPGGGNLPPDPGISPPGPGNLPRSPIGPGLSPPGPGNLPRGPVSIAAPMRAGITSPDDLARMFPTATPASSPAGGYDLEAFRKRWYGKGDVNNIQGWLDANRDITTGVTLRNEKAYDPSGRFIADLVGNYSGADPSQRTAIFLDGIGAGNRPRGKITGPISPPGPGNLPPTGPTGPAGPAGTPPAANNFLTQIRQLIMERLGKMSGDPSMDDPALKAQSAAYARSRRRGADRERAAMAERAAAQGLLLGGQSSGGFDTALGGINEAASEDIAGNDAALMGQEVQARRAEVQQLMNMALASGDAESARALQMQLAQLDAQLRREALRENARQFGLSDKYRWAGLNEGKRQWNDQYGRQLGRDYEDDYWRRVLYGMGG